MLKKDVNFEINLLPVISLLAVLICFLMLTVAWVDIGSLNIKQALGGQSQSETKKTNNDLWITVRNGTVYVRLENPSAGVSSRLRSLKINRIKSKRGQKKLSRYIRRLQAKVSDIGNTFVSPTRNSSYATIIAIIDTLRKNKLKNIGINPL